MIIAERVIRCEVTSAHNPEVFPGSSSEMKETHEGAGNSEGFEY